MILDNLHNVHDHPRFLALLRRLRVQPVWTPTEASWLNLIEAQFGVLKRFTLPPPMTPTTRHGGAASTRIFATDTANSTTCIFHSTESAHLGLLSSNDTRGARLPRGEPQVFAGVFRLLRTLQRDG